MRNSFEIFGLLLASFGWLVVSFHHSTRATSQIAVWGYTRKIDGDPDAAKRKAIKAAKSAKPATAVPSPIRPGKAMSLEQLEMQVLSKYGSNAFKDVVEEGWEDDEDEEKPAKKGGKKARAAEQGPLAQYGMVGKFQGFGAKTASDRPDTTSYDDEKSSEDQETDDEVESGLLSELGKLRSSRGKPTTEMTADDFFDDESSDRNAPRTPVKSVKRASTLLGGRLGRASPEASVEPDASRKSVSPKKSFSTVSELLASDDYEGSEDDDLAPPKKKERWARGAQIGSAVAAPDTAQPDSPKRYTVPPANAAISSTTRLDSRSSSSTSPSAQEPAPSFRLRPPAPKSQTEIDKEVAAAAKAIADEEERQRRRKEKKENEKNEFFPFDFSLSAASGGDTDSASFDGDRIFTSSTFDELGISNAHVLANLQKMKIFNPTRIQEKAVPELLKGGDALIHAQTGSGKTLTFLLPLTSVIDVTKNKVQCIILAPSRELVTQIASVAEKLFADTGIRTVPIIGGANVRGQIDKIRDQRPQILVASPGRLAELVFRLEVLKLGNVRAVIVDEVDNLLQDSYRGDVEVLLEATGVGRARARGGGGGGEQGDSSTETEEDDVSENASRAENAGKSVKTNQFICLASATGSSPAVSSFADRFCNDWKKVSIDAASPLPRTITHGLISTPRMRALEQLRKFLSAKPAVQWYAPSFFY